MVAQHPRVPDRRPAPRAQGKALNNFKRTLPPADSDFAAQVFKDPYLFDFLGTADPRQEHEVEASLVAHVERFLLELGSGFAFVGRQVPLEVGGDDFKLDLLFYHFKLRRFVVVELKAVKFDPGMVGQLHMYLSAVDDMLKQPDDQPTIGLLLCRGKNELSRRVRAPRSTQADGSRGLGDTTRREAAGRAQGELTQHRGDRGCAGATETEDDQDEEAMTRLTVRSLLQ